MKNTLINADLLDVIQDIPDDTFDLIIADPPYGIKKDYGLADSYSNLEEYVAWCGKWLRECKRVLAPSGSLFVYGIHNYLCFLQVELYKLEMNYVRQIIWHYDNGFCGHKSLPRATYEPLLWFTKEERFFFSTIREPYKSAERLKYKIIKNGKTWIPHPDGRIVGDIWEIPTLAGRRFKDEKVEHPSQKPLALCDRIIRHCSPEKGKVFVPFAGSGSECVSAWNQSRVFKGVEINSDYCKLIEKRLKALGCEIRALRIRDITRLEHVGE